MNDKEYFQMDDFAQELKDEVSKIDAKDDRRATALGFCGLGHIHAGFITAAEWTEFAQMFLDKFNFPPTETVLQVKFNEIMGK